MKYLWILIPLLASCSQPKTVSLAQDNTAKADEMLYVMARTYLHPLPENAADDDHPITPELVALGKELYNEKAISLDGSISCNTCHPLDHFGADTLAYSKGVNQTLGDRNSPTTYNAALALAQFWDGRAKDVEEQVEGPLFNPKEMAMPSKIAVVQRLLAIPKYSKMFAKAFDGESMTYAQVAQAIGAFERTLLTPSRLDLYLGGDLSVLSQIEKKGLKNMLDYGCIPCHSGPAMGGALYQKFGLFNDYRKVLTAQDGDVGMLGWTHQETDRDVYKVPSLRNITHTGPYFHNGSVQELEDAIRVMGKLQLGVELNPQEVKEIKAFLAVSADWLK